METRNAYIYIFLFTHWLIIILLLYFIQKKDRSNAIGTKIVNALYLIRILYTHIAFFLKNVFL